MGLRTSRPATRVSAGSGSFLTGGPSYTNLEPRWCSSNLKSGNLIWPNAVHRGDCHSFHLELHGRLLARSCQRCRNVHVTQLLFGAQLLCRVNPAFDIAFIAEIAEQLFYRGFLVLSQRHRLILLAEPFIPFR